jgi:hypothetical protein
MNNKIDNVVVVSYKRLSGKINIKLVLFTSILKLNFLIDLSK